MSDLRQRKPTPTFSPSSPEKKKSPAELAAAEDSAFSYLDVLRALFFLAITSTALSYFITKESFVWGLERPSWSHVETIKSYFSGPKQYTDSDLLLHDGRDPTIPLLLAINGTIYDVSAGRRHYGPGGSYSVFAGADASRAFVTTCFDTDRNPDMRGLEEMFIPFDNEEVDSQYTPEALADLRKREVVFAREQVHATLKHWVDFFESSRKYPKIGRVKRASGWETKGPVKKLCKQATDSRPKKRNLPGPGQAKKAA